MWIILLDCSGSMADPFEATDFKFQGTLRRFAAAAKLEAAKKAVLFHLARLDEATEVVLFGFTSAVEKICAARAGEVKRFEHELAKVKAHNGTDIAAALNHAVGYLAERPDITLKPVVLLISDGKSDVEEAKMAARNCINAGMRIDMLVIDPTDEGMQMAKAIVRITQGQLEPVTSADEVLSGTGEAADRFKRETAKAAEILAHAEEESIADHEEAVGRPEVSFTAGYPKIIDRGRRYPMRVYVHLSALGDEIEKLLRKKLAQLSSTLATSTATAALPIAHGRLITIQPNIPNIFANPPRHEIVWVDDYHGLEFQVSYSGEERGPTVCSGFIDILVDGLIVGQIPVSISVPAEGTTVPARHAPEVETVKMLSRIFASYAHEDEAVVRACKAYYRTLGIHLYVDRDELLSGDPWRGTLAKLIEEYDLFQLYWSKHAAASSEVAKEWQLALDVSRSRPWNFIRPFYWQKPMPNAPTALKEIHFGFLDLNNLKIDLETAIQGTAVKPYEQSKQVAALFPIIPLEPDITPGITDHLQEALRRVIPYLENLADLRYYPPPTLLVDDYTVTQVRSRITVDKEPDESRDVRWALDVVQSLALAFHVRTADFPSGISDNQRRQFHGLKTEEEWGDYRHVRKLCEYLFYERGAVVAYLSGNDPLHDRDSKYLNSLREYIKEARTSSFTFSLDEELRKILNMAQHNDRKRIERIFGVNPLPALSDMKKQQATEFSQLLNRLESEEFQEIAARYETAFARLFDEYPTTLQRSLDFPTYLQRFFDLWLRYLATVENHKGEEFIDVGYSVPLTALTRFKQRFPDISFTTGELRKGFGDAEPNYEWSMSLSNYRRAVTALSKVILNAVQADSGGQKLVKNFLATVATFGVFVSARLRDADARLAELASRNGWPGGISLAGSHKTLLSMKALERYRQGLLDAGMDRQHAENMARMFLTATLVHEHFHGLAETAVDGRGHASVASDLGGWDSGSILNEALAAWTERHYFRHDKEMFQTITDYINAGEYPTWPYRGAEMIEKIFNDKGLPGVRSLIGQLRDDPTFAQKNFDALIAQAG